jgi:hypothetical protein
MPQKFCSGLREKKHFYVQKKTSKTLSKIKLKNKPDANAVVCVGEH